MRLGPGPHLWKITAWFQRYNDFTDSHSLGSISIQLHTVNNSNYIPRYLTTTGKRISLCGILKNDADELLKKTETDSDFECKLTVTKGGKGE